MKLAPSKLGCLYNRIMPIGNDQENACRGECPVGPFYVYIVGLGAEYAISLRAAESRPWGNALSTAR